MSNQYYFDVPFAFSGDVTPIPDPLQTGGTVSFTEGWNYNYQRDLATDPAALPIDRSTMNWLLLQITAALQQLQGGTVPEFILASQNGGTAYPYGPQAEVLWSASGNAPFTKYVNISGGTNSNTPSASDPTGATTGWQIACDPLSTSAQAAAGTNNASIMTPLLVAQQTALRALLAGSTSQVFNVGAATALTHAPQALQVQQSAFNYAVAGGTANALTAALTPAPTAYTDDLLVVVRVTAANTGATTLQVGALAATSVVGAAHVALQGGELIAGGFAWFAYSTNLSKFVLLYSTGGAEQVGNATQSQHALTLGQATGRLLRTSVYRNNGGTLQVSIDGGAFATASSTFTAQTLTTKVDVEVQAGGGAGGGAASTGAGQVAAGSGGGGGGYTRAVLTSGFAGASIAVGAGGASVTGAAGNPGASSSFGTLSATGGAGGSLGAAASNTSAGFAGGAGGGQGSGGVIVAQGGYGWAAYYGAQTLSGKGGSSQFGDGAAPATGTSGGSAATSYGSGGAGGSLAASSGTAAGGGSGASGLVIVREYA